MSYSHKDKPTIGEALDGVVDAVGQFLDDVAEGLHDIKEEARELVDELLDPQVDLPPWPHASYTPPPPPPLHSALDDEARKRMDEAFDRMGKDFETIFGPGFPFGTYRSPRPKPAQPSAPTQPKNATTSVSIDELATMLAHARSDASPTGRERAHTLLNRARNAVFRSARDDIKREYALTALTINDETLAKETYTALEHPTNRELVLLGVLAYESKEKGDAARYFARAKEMAPTDALPTRLVLQSRMRYEQGEILSATHIPLLAPVTSASADAAMLLGVVHFNNAELTSAEELFRAAVALRRDSVEAHTYLISAIAARDKDPSVRIAAMRDQTGYVLEGDERLRTLNRFTLELPRYQRVQPLVEIVGDTR
jgi:Flp pilus assembly protein TadD